MHTARRWADCYLKLGEGENYKSDREVSMPWDANEHSIIGDMASNEKGWETKPI